MVLPPPRQLALPSGEGLGRFARGGRGGKVVHVTNLNDLGQGSLRAAVDDVLGPRTVVFDVGGVVALTAPLIVSQNYITFAGQTAPGKGIVIRGAPFATSGARDVVMRSVRVRVGGDRTFDGVGLGGSDHCIINHSSISWTVSHAFSSPNAKNITLQRSLISECLNVAGHPGLSGGRCARVRLEHRR